MLTHLNLIESYHILHELSLAAMRDAFESYGYIPDKDAYPNHEV